MSKSVERYGNELRALRNFAESLTYASSVEQVYTFGLNALGEIFAPDSAFVALAESGSSKGPGSLPRPGWLSEIVFPIHSGDKVAGLFMLQYKKTRRFTEADLLIAEMISLHAGAVIHQLQRQQQKDELVAMAVHELRSPLTAILGGTFMLRTGKGGSPESSMEMIERNARVQTKLVEELLHVSRDDTGKFPLQMKVVDLTSVLDHVLDEVRLAVAAGNTALIKAFDRSLQVKGDERRLWQIFSNLLSNAVRYAPDGEVRIRSSVEDGTIKIEIADNGIGIEREDLAHIFERFRQAPSAKPQRHEGLGLGLSIVKDLVTMHGGSVTAESDGVGKGANFVVFLPAA